MSFVFPLSVSFVHNSLLRRDERLVSSLISLGFFFFITPSRRNKVVLVLFFLTLCKFLAGFADQLYFCMIFEWIWTSYVAFSWVRYKSIYALIPVSLLDTALLHFLEVGFGSYFQYYFLKPLWIISFFSICLVTSSNRVVALCWGAELINSHI